MSADAGARGMSVVARGLDKRYGAVHALRGIDLSIEAGRRVALIGPNGSGKSTLIRALLGLVACDGEVIIGGMDAATSRREIARRTAHVPQVAPQIAAPVRELVRAIAAVRGLAESDVAEVAARLDLDLAAIARQPFRNLSGGMKQKLLIALALASRADLLVMDEPTASLDVASRERFFGMQEDLAPGATLVLCSHRLEEIRHMVDDVVALSDGRVAHAAPADAWLAACAGSIVEVRLRSAESGPALRSLGFSEGRGGWWRRTAIRDEAVALACALPSRLNGGMDDIVIRHVERIDGREEHAHARTS